MSALPSKIALRLYLGLFLLFFATSSGGFESGDALTRYETALSLVAGHRGELPLRTARYNGAVPNAQGKLYSCFGILQPLLMVPPVVVASRLPLSASAKEAVAKLSFNLVILPGLSALALTLLFLALVQLGYSVRAAVAATLAAGLGTPFWHYARCAQEENLVALGFALWLFGMARFENRKSGSLWLVALGGVVAFSARWAAVAPLAGLAFFTIASVGKRRGEIKIREVGGPFLLAAASFAAVLYYNDFRFGSPWETGYGLLFQRLGRPLFVWPGSLARAIALLFSPYRGLFLYAPVLLLALPVALSNRNGQRWPLIVGYLGLTSALILNVGYTEWTSGYSWGPRFLVAPLILVGPLWAAFFDSRRPVNLATLGILIGAFLWQLASVSLPAAAEEIYRTRAQIPPNQVSSAWQPGYSPLGLRIPWLLAAAKNTATGKPGIVFKSGTDDESLALESSDFRTLFWWPFRFAFRYGVFSRMVAALLSATLFLLSFLVLRQTWRSTTSAPVFPLASAP